MSDRSFHPLNRRAGVLCVALMIAAPVGALAAGIETVLYSFKGAPADGAEPYAGVIADRAGNLYGTTVYGGASGNGTVFKLSPGGTETVLHSFTGAPDGANPYAGLIADSAGNLYGATVNGGASTNPSTPLAIGLVFKLSPGGVETALHSFVGANAAHSFLGGAQPYAGLIADSAGNLYGTTMGGGMAGYGTVFKLSPSGTETVLHSFQFGEGFSPNAGLIADSAGNLYGTTVYGGGAVNGVVFKLSPDGAYTVLHSFAGGPGDGRNPYASLIADSAGNLYGTTVAGGAYDAGVVFRVSPGGTYTVLHSFTGADGAKPYGGLIADSAGNLYGTTETGGESGSGVVFKLSSGGTYTVLHSFIGVDGAGPDGSLVADSAGNLFGTTRHGGTYNQGVVFKLSGTGFAMAVPFTTFQAGVGIELGRKTNTDAFQLVSGFTLGQGSPGIDPLTQPVTLQIGSFVTTIPPGSFKRFFGSFYFGGTIGGVNLSAGISPTAPKQYAFGAAAQKANLSGTLNPVTVKLTIGNNTGSASVRAVIVH